MPLHWDPWNIVVEYQNAVGFLQVVSGRKPEMKRMAPREIDPVTRLHHGRRERFCESNQRGYRLGIPARIGHKNQGALCFDQPLRRLGEVAGVSRWR